MSNEVEKVQDNVSVMMPRVDIVENEKEVVVTADLPGVSEQSLNIDLEGSTLEIKGTAEVQMPEGFTMSRNEFQPVRRYERQFTLGDAIDREQIAATMKDGVLKLVLPKNVKQQSRRIEVKMG